MREVAGALGGDQDQGATAVGHQTALQQAERVGDHPGIEDVFDGDWRLEGGPGVFGRPFALHDRDHRQLLVHQAVGLHVAQYRDREQSRRPHWPIGLPELADEAGGCCDIARAPNDRAAALAMRDQHRPTQARLDRPGGVADMDHERAPTDRGAVDPFRRHAQVMGDRYRRLAGGGDAIDVEWFQIDHLSTAQVDRCA